LEPIYPGILKTYPGWFNTIKKNIA
jgi:hypothetical protein